MKLIVSCGLPGAGKEEFLKAAEEMGIDYVRMGDVVRDAYASRPADLMDLSVGGFAARMRELEGPDCWARRTVRKAKGEAFIIDGCRSMDEIAMFRECSDDVTVVGIYASPRTRYERLVKRGRDDAPHDISEFDERDEREMSWGSAKTLSLADILLVNEGSIDDFRRDARKVLGEVCGR